MQVRQGTQAKLGEMAASEQKSEAFLVLVPDGAPPAAGMPPPLLPSGPIYGPLQFARLAIGGV